MGEKRLIARSDLLTFITTTTNENLQTFNPTYPSEKGVWLFSKRQIFFSILNVKCDPDKQVFINID